MARQALSLGTATVIRANARDLPLADNSVDLVVTSPPYFALRSYQDGGEHYAGQIGDEPTPAEFVASLLEVTRECVRVLKPSGSLWVNLGDKYAGQGSRIARSTSASSSAASYSASPESPSLASSQVDNAASASARSSSVIGIDPTSFSQGARDGNRRSRPSPVDGIPGKSLMGIPWRYALACIDDLGLILRAEVIWSKPNGLPESVTDRVRRSHETWFHFTLEPRYFSAVDEIREKYDAPTATRSNPGRNHNRADGGGNPLSAIDSMNPLGKLPGSVWTVPTEPLRVPDHLGIDHFAAFPTEWPKRIIQGWSPAGVCVECGEGLRPVVEQSEARWDGRSAKYGPTVHDPNSNTHGTPGSTLRMMRDKQIVGYACGCENSLHTPDLPQSGQVVGASPSHEVSDTSSMPLSMTENTAEPVTSSRESLPHDGHDTPAKEFTFTGSSSRIRPAVVLDPFGGTGTTALVAKALGRHGITIDMSADYCRLAEWRTNDRNQLAKVLGIEKAPVADVEQLDLFGEEQTA